MRGLQKINAKSYRRWGEVAEYLDALLPVIQQNEQLAPAVNTFVASAFRLPPCVEGHVHFVGDVPYGRSSHMLGESGVGSLVDSIAASHPTATMTFITTRDMAEDIISETTRATIETKPCGNGRAVVYATPTPSPS
jgi:hypothetical protein